MKQNKLLSLITALILLLAVFSCKDPGDDLDDLNNKSDTTTGGETKPVVNKTPEIDDFIIGDLTQDVNDFTFTITSKPDKSSGTITVYYEGIEETVYPKSETEPTEIGLYAVTFDVAAVTGWNAASGLSAGTLLLSNSTFQTPTVSDYDISGIGTFEYDGTAKAVTVTAKTDKSGGTITVKYNGNTTAPDTAGTYTVTFDVSKAEGWNPAKELSAGTLTINGINPTVSDYDISGIGTFAYDGTAKVVTVTAKNGKSTGTVIVKYNGNTIVPSTAGTYTVTFDVFASTNWNSASGLSAGTLTINKANPIAAMFNIGNLTQKSASLTAVTIKSKDDNTSEFSTVIYYEGIDTNYAKSATLPTSAGTYTVTFDITGTTNWYAASGLSAGTLTYNVFTNIDEIDTFLLSLPENDKTNPYQIKLNVNSISNIRTQLINNEKKYIYLDLSDSTITKITIDDFYGSYPFGCNTLVGITIPSSVTSIGQRAFNGCSSLTSINIPSSVTSIEQYAFYGCSSLTSVNIPSGITKIEPYAFYGCSSLTSVTIPSGVTSIGQYAFYGCYLTSVTIPSAVTSIGNAAFSGYLTRIIFESNGVVFTAAAFNGNTSLLSAYNKYGAGTYTITYTTNVGTWSNVAIPIVSDFDISGIGTYTYNGSPKIVTITPKTGKSDGAITVKYAGSTTAPTNVGTYAVTFDITSSAEWNAVSGLSAGTLTIGKATPIVSDYDISGIGTINYDGKTKTVTVIAKEGKSSGKVTVKYNGSTTVPSNAGIYTVTFDVAAETTNWNAATGLSAGTLIINKLTPVASDYNFSGIGTFTYDGNPKTVTIQSKTGKSTGACTIYYEGTGDTTYTKSNTAPTSAGTYTITFDVAETTNWNSAIGLFAGTLILNNATPIANDFNISKLTQIITNNITNVAITPKTGKSTGTITIYYNGSTTLPTAIGTYPVTFNVAATSNWNAVSGLSAGTLTIAYYPFNNVSDFTLYLPELPTNTAATAYEIKLNSSISFTELRSTIKNNANKYINLDISGSTIDGVTSSWFDGCTNLTSITLPNNITTVENNAFSGCSNLTGITIPSGVTSIGNGAFSGCSSLTSITLPSGVTSIGGSAFSGCSSLTSIILPSGVTSISKGAFNGCSSLTSIIIPSGVTSIWDYSFQNCSNLASINIPNSVTEIGYGAFSGCTNLASVTIPSYVTRIENDAFLNCSKLTSINIPNTVTRIGDSSAFRGCSSLTAINVDIANTTYSSINGVLYDKTITTLIQYPAGKEGAYTIPSGVTFIRVYAFDSCTKLTSLTMPNSINSVACTFDECTSLTSVKFEGTIPSNKWLYSDTLRNAFYSTNSIDGTPGTYIYQPSTGTWKRQ